MLHGGGTRLSYKYETDEVVSFLKGLASMSHLSKKKIKTVVAARGKWRYYYISEGKKYFTNIPSYLPVPEGVFRDTFHDDDFSYFCEKLGAKCQHCNDIFYPKNCEDLEPAIEDVLYSELSKSGFSRPTFRGYHFFCQNCTHQLNLGFRNGYSPATILVRDSLKILLRNIRRSRVESYMKREYDYEAERKKEFLEKKIYNGFGLAKLQRLEIEELNVILSIFEKYGF